MDEYVISLADAAATDADRVGPKAANLAALAQAGSWKPIALRLLRLTSWTARV